MIYKRCSKIFYNAMKFDAHEGQADDLTLSICFDYMQNLQLPHIPIQETFYLRRLNVYVFSIHDIKKNNAKLNVYHEGQAKKEPDEIVLFF